MRLLGNKTLERARSFAAEVPARSTAVSTTSFMARQAGTFSPHPFFQLADERSDCLLARRHTFGR